MKQRLMTRGGALGFDAQRDIAEEYIALHAKAFKEKFGSDMAPETIMVMRGAFNDGMEAIASDAYYLGKCDALAQARLSLGITDPVSKD